MRNVLRNTLILAAFACCSIAGMTAANADVLRIATVVAANQADYDNNVALIPTLAALLNKGTGIKSVYFGTDAAKLTLVTTSVWPSEADIYPAQLEFGHFRSRRGYRPKISATNAAGSVCC